MSVWLRRRVKCQKLRGICKKVKGKKKKGLTTCGFVEASFLCQLSQCKTSVDHCFLCSPEIKKTTLEKEILISHAEMLCCVCVRPLFIPSRSAKPPMGRRQVPVTNCRSLILFSLSISFTNCQEIMLWWYHRLFGTNMLPLLAFSWDWSCDHLLCGPKKNHPK